jgi:hypothetical protein
MSRKQIILLRLAPPREIILLLIVGDNIIGIFEEKWEIFEV